MHLYCPPRSTFHLSKREPPPFPQTCSHSAGLSPLANGTSTHPAPQGGDLGVTDNKPLFSQPSPSPHPPQPLLHAATSSLRYRHLPGSGHQHHSPGPLHHPAPPGPWPSPWKPFCTQWPFLKCLTLTVMTGWGGDCPWPSAKSSNPPRGNEALRGLPDSSTPLPSPST